MTGECVLDASAILALINREPGWEQVADVERPVVSAVNYAEVGSLLMQRGLTVGDMRLALDSIDARVVDFNTGHAIEVARLRPLTNDAGLSLGDRACLALAGITHLPALTADRQWTRIDVGVAVSLIR